MPSRTQYHPAARVDRGGRNAKGRMLRKEHLEAQRLIAERIISESEARSFLPKAQVERMIDAKLREVRELMGAPSPRF